MKFKEELKKLFPKNVLLSFLFTFITVVVTKNNLISKGDLTIYIAIIFFNYLLFFELKDLKNMVEK